MRLGYACSGPAPRNPVELVAEGAHADRDRAALGGEEATPHRLIQASRGDPAVSQPVEGDVVEDVIAREVARPRPPREPRRGKAGWWRSRSPRLARCDVDRPWCSQALPLPLIGAGDNPTGNPSTVQDLVAICCVDTAHAARQVSLAPGCVRVRPPDSPSGQSEWPVVAGSGPTGRG